MSVILCLDIIFQVWIPVQISILEMNSRYIGISVRFQLPWVNESRVPNIRNR